MNSRGATAAMAVVVGLVAFAVGLVILGSRTTWSAQARAALEVAPMKEPKWVTAYKKDLLTRETILPTYGAIVADERFVDEAAHTLGLSEQARPGVSVDVEAVSTDAFITITATAQSPRIASAMADGVLQTASRFIESLDRSYELNAAQALHGPPAPNSGLSVTSTATLGVLCALGGIAVYNVLPRLRARLGWTAPTT